MIENLLDDLPKAADQESLVDLLKRPGVRIERIVSTGQASPPGFWYDQAHGEWVVVLAGEARLRFEDEPAARTLRARRFRRHRRAPPASGRVDASGRADRLARRALRLGSPGGAGSRTSRFA